MRDATVGFKRSGLFVRALARNVRPLYESVRLLVLIAALTVPLTVRHSRCDRVGGKSRLGQGARFVT